jgi:hypothetical protein
MTQEALKQLNLALETMEAACKRIDELVAENKALKEALAQPEQDIAATIDLQKKAQQIVESKALWKKFIDGTPLENDIACWMTDFAQQYIASPQRTWVDLTQQELDELDEQSPSLHDFVQNLMSKLKEKNSA